MKPLATYAALIPVPVAGLFAVLRLGGALNAPPAIGGDWLVQSPRAQTLALAQSGTHVSATLAGAEYRGELRGDSLLAEPRGAAACTSLRARIDTAASPGTMTLALEPATRPECGGPYTAVRAARAEKGER